MKHRILSPYFLLLAVYCCSCQPATSYQQPLAEDTTAKLSAVAVSQPDTSALPDANFGAQAGLLTEDFEQAAGSKSSYVTAELAFKSGNWLFADALLGNSKADHGHGRQAVRIRNTGKLTMQFDLNSVSAVRIYAAVYGNDGPSSWQLWASRDQGLSYQQIGETIQTSKGGLTAADFVLHTSGAIRLEIRKVSGGKNRINIDDLTIEGKGEAVSVPPAIRPGAIAEKKVKPGKTSDDSQLLLGNPSAATHTINNADNYLIDHQFYVESYSRAKAIPNWVSWHISTRDLGNAKRQNDFRADITLPAGWYEADNTSYKGSGFDKGHNCPSGDRTSSSSANSATFLMTNMVPQAPNNNQHTWEHLESYCRDQVKKGNEVYVLMGSYGSGGTGTNGYRTTIDNGRIHVPAHIWKVVVIIPDGNDDLSRINAETRVIAIDTPNDNGLSSNWMDYTCTVRAIEKATGYDLLSALPKKIQDVIELKTFKGGN